APPAGPVLPRADRAGAVAPRHPPARVGRADPGPAKGSGGVLRRAGVPGAHAPGDPADPAVPVLLEPLAVAVVPPAGRAERRGCGYPRQGADEPAAVGVTGRRRSGGRAPVRAPARGDPGERAQAVRGDAPDLPDAVSPHP